MTTNQARRRVLVDAKPVGKAVAARDPAGSGSGANAPPASPSPRTLAPPSLARRVLKLAALAALVLVTWRLETARDTVPVLPALLGALDRLFTGLWTAVLDVCGHDRFLTVAVAPNLIHFVSFWLCGLAFLVLDFAQPAWLQLYRTQDIRKPMDRAKFWRAIRLILFNQLVVNPAVSLVAYPLMQWRGMAVEAPLPAFWVVLLQFAGFMVCEEIGFYYSHRSLHWGELYKRVHKVHHEWTAPIAITAIYAHPVEHVLGNLMPVLSGPILFGAHSAVLVGWTTFAVTMSMIHHSGYHLPLLSSPEWHDFHHLRFNQNYGVMGVLDKLHGTSEQWLRSRQSQRHFLLTSITPARVLVPDLPRAVAHAAK